MEIKTANKVWNSQIDGRLQLGIIHVMLPGDSLSVFQTVPSWLPASSEFQTFFFLLSCRKRMFRKMWTDPFDQNSRDTSTIYLSFIQNATYRIRLRGATVARLTPDQKVACSNHVGVKVSPFYMTTVLFKDNSFSLSDDLPYWESSFEIYLVKKKRIPKLDQLLASVFLTGISILTKWFPHFIQGTYVFCFMFLRRKYLLREQHPPSANMNITYWKMNVSLCPFVADMLFFLKHVVFFPRWNVLPCVITDSY